MQRVRKILTGLLIMLLVLIVVAAAGGTWFVRRSWPQTSGTLAAAGLSAPVKITRDKWGVPHIYAQNERDLVFGQGYVHAQDRLWQMEFNRRISSGTLSAMIGAPTVGFDKLTRGMGLRRSAEAEWQTLTPANKVLLESYAAGVNAFIDRHRNRLPVEFTIMGVDPQPWTPIDTLAWGKVMSWNLGHNFAEEMLRARFIAAEGTQMTQELFAPFRDGPALAIPPGVNNYAWLRDADLSVLTAQSGVAGGPTAVQGSNGLVVSGSRTASGKPLLANDTHLYMEMPSLWYENGLHGGGFNSVGFSFPGVPMVIIGQNTRISWGITDLPADVQDFYIETLDDPARPTKYQHQGEWHDLQVIPEVIEVSGGQPVTMNVLVTQHGPIMNESLGSDLTEDEAVALQWTVIRGTALVESLIALNRAGNWNEFRQALAGWGAPNLNFVYADVDGNIGYQAAGAVPRRSADHQGLVPVPGASGAYEWQGLVPFEELPTSYNPPEGFFANANNQVSTESQTQPLSYEWGDPYRIARIKALMADKDKLTIADMQALQADTFSSSAETLRPYLLSISSDDDLERRALEQVRDWNLQSDLDQPGAAIFNVWSWHILTNTINDQMDEDLSDDYGTYFWLHPTVLRSWLPQADNLWFDDLTTTQRETRDDIVRLSLTETVSWLRERYGDDPAQWHWGKLHTMNFSHRPLGQAGIAPLSLIFNSPTVPVPGDNFTLNAAWSNPDFDFIMSGGVSQRLIVDLSDLTQSLAIHGTGQTEQIFHPHRHDLMKLWQKAEYHPVLTTEEAVAAQGVATLTLVPPAP